ncbi:penicillin-binding transpeptidase domain-containing protein [Allobacillus sp. GCM10007491]|uniref:serine-type D-Ala-D-Ala carboxypeptidase n=1 Tax=Allobacillus saliphilus TaxID=2912308 RepID=A0A941CVI2_9BACI|nr:penicillin-binding transpeptidase domain-containing protein [Allobacillus saliphilus]MBR7553188.1 penicillin-binding transpeptidase domain-containing protein [Allobacillus saliphilus]
MKRTIVLFLTIILFLAACSEEETQYPNPNDTADEYIEKWMQNDFEGLYKSYLSENTKTAFSHEDFVERYNHLYDALSVDQVTIERTEPVEELPNEELKTMTEYEVPIQISFNTLAGQIQYENTLQLTRPLNEDEEDEKSEEDRWFVEWDPSFIMPGMQAEDEVRYQTTPASRGEILDRNGNLIAANGEVYEVGVTPMDFNENSLSELANILNVSSSSIKEKYTQSWVDEDHFVPVKKFMLDDEDIVENAVAITGVSSRVVVDRIYPYKDVLGHLTGYIGQVTAEDLEELEGKGYSSSDIVGKRGLEQLYEDQLRGINGVELYIEKPDGSKTPIAAQEAKDGEDITVTIDAELQSKLYSVLKEEKGTATTIDPKTGEVTSLVSLPSFDPNRFVHGITDEEYNMLSEDTNQPLINRFSSTYSPGSTMKLLTTIAGLNAGTLDPNEALKIEGKRWQKDDSWGDFKVTRVSTNHTNVDLETGFKHSDNIYFAMQGLKMGGETFRKELEALGFAESIPFAYPMATSQISNSGEFSSEGQLADSAYGQGEVLINIVHLSSIYGGIANEGDVQKPLLLKAESPEVWLSEITTSENVERLQGLLRKVVTEGTAKAAEINGREIAGKTGTAELKASHEDENDEQNGLFISYDQNKPDFVLGILLEGVQDKGGSGYAVEKAKMFYEKMSQ